MKKNNLTITSLLIAVLLILATGCPQSGSGPTKSGTVVPPANNFKAATDFTFATFSGESGKMSSYTGKPLVVNFWATW